MTATFAAGTNSASVKTTEGLMLYKASDYGRHIEVFRFGQWVTDMAQAAEAILAVHEAEGLIQTDEIIRTIANNFSEI